MSETLQSLIEYCRENDRACPMPDDWDCLWDMLPNKRRVGNGWVPSLPLILAGWPERNKGKPWTDAEPRVVLSDAPTKENCVKHAKAFGRGYGALEQVYRWAATTDPEIKRLRPNDKFIAQIKRVAKELGWRA